MSATYSLSSPPVSDKLPPSLYVLAKISAQASKAKTGLYFLGICHIATDSATTFFFLKEKIWKFQPGSQLQA